MNPLWLPSNERIANSEMTRFQHYAEQRYDKKFPNYDELFEWSVTSTDDFWTAIWDFCELKASIPYAQTTINLDQFPGTRWFSESKLNFAENLMRYKDHELAMAY